MSVYEKAKKDYDKYFKSLGKGSFNFDFENFDSSITDLEITIKFNLVTVKCRVSHGTKVQNTNLPPCEIKINKVLVDRVSTYIYGAGYGVIKKQVIESVEEFYYPCCVDVFEESYGIDKNSVFRLNSLVDFLRRNKTWVTQKNICEIKKGAKNILNKLDKNKFKLKKSIKGCESKTYIIKDSNTGLYKIGKSKNPIKRERTLQGEKPTLSIIKVFEKDIEKKLHDVYIKQRIRGEWFNLTPIQVRYICTHY
jgi:hypothetical protein